MHDETSYVVNLDGMVQSLKLRTAIASINVRTPRVPVYFAFTFLRLHFFAFTFTCVLTLNPRPACPAPSIWLHPDRMLLSLLCLRAVVVGPQSKYGKHCGRIVRLLLEKKQLEEKHVRVLILCFVTPPLWLASCNQPWCAL